MLYRGQQSLIQSRPIVSPPRGNQPVVPPLVPGDAPVLQAKGLEFIWQDRIGEVGGPSTDWDVFQETTGATRFDDPVGQYTSEEPYRRRLHLATFDGRSCLQVVYYGGKHGWLNYRSQYLPIGYRELGMAVDVFIPSSFRLFSTALNKGIHGKSPFGLSCGTVDYRRVGGPYPFTGMGEVTPPEDQHGCALGLNTGYDANTNEYSLAWYPHIPGNMSNGVYKPRTTQNNTSAAFSTYYNVGTDIALASPPRLVLPRDRWFTLSLYGKMDTDAHNALLELWITDGGAHTKGPSIYNFDLGGWVGNRNLYRGRTLPAGTWNPNSFNSQVYSYGVGDLCNDNYGGQNPRKGGWRFRGIFIRDMLGGWTANPNGEFVNQTTVQYYTNNWRVYGIV